MYRNQNPLAGCDLVKTDPSWTKEHRFAESRAQTGPLPSVLSDQFDQSARTARPRGDASAGHRPVVQGAASWPGVRTEI